MNNDTKTENNLATINGRAYPHTPRMRKPFRNFQAGGGVRHIQRPPTTAQRQLSCPLKKTGP